MSSINKIASSFITAKEPLKNFIGVTFRDIENSDKEMVIATLSVIATRESDKHFDPEEDIERRESVANAVKIDVIDRLTDYPEFKFLLKEAFVQGYYEGFCDGEEGAMDEKLLLKLDNEVRGYYC